MIKETLNKPGIVVDRWILRLGKNDEEAGRFQPWFLPSNTLDQDFAGFLACLNLLKLHEAVKDRMSTQKKGVREIRKQQKAEQKEIAKMKAKVEAAAAKTQKKLDRAVERERIKAEAKKNREEAKRASKVVGGNSEGSTKDRVHLPTVRQDVAVEETAEPVAVVQPVLQTEQASTVYEDFPVERRPFVVPEEG